MKNKKIVWILSIVIVAVTLAFTLPNISKNNGTKENMVNDSLDASYTGNDFEEIYLAGGCFWE